MPDRFHSLVVVLDEDLRDEEAEDLILAIRMLRHVEEVTGVEADLTTLMAESRAKSQLRERILRAFEEE